MVKQAMNLQQLITFSTVISEGSMTAAAEKLYLTQPAVSQQIRNLEDEMGVGLLDRGSRHAKPTMHGQLLYDYAKRIIALTQQAQVAIQTMGEGVKGKLRLGTLELSRPSTREPGRLFVSETQFQNLDVALLRGRRQSLRGPSAR